MKETKAILNKQQALELEKLNEGMIAEFESEIQHFYERDKETMQQSKEDLRQTLKDEAHQQELYKLKTCVQCGGTLEHETRWDGIGPNGEGRLIEMSGLYCQTCGKGYHNDAEQKIIDEQIEKDKK